ncbi:Uncharacterised protein [Mycobacterium tuberculosis]|uniref:Uncharacterized protein n=2 Tax=Mycobacterium tuberculosis TaxID=1773 RepID=A0A0T9G7Z8_MYCTX|nr:Uncharacterised protein [Mycobacterium tuberculosis]CFR39925.1 Uncharacterised protein [Mycobacterium tuberculosis]CFR95710.1 Uncharacterised protein [Mycobacterium tuberculosis]CFS16093.1 Uncharacterised protein [Mycobacterium tuberculosis]CFS20979.1 Uncharacterised protein [Mycobacterium tuberculosis]
MPLRATSFWWASGSPLARAPSPELLTDAMFSPGAAMPTHGPGMLNFDGCPADVSDATDNT